MSVSGCDRMLELDWKWRYKSDRCQIWKLVS